MQRTEKDWAKVATDLEDAACAAQLRGWNGTVEDLRKTASSIRWHLNWERRHPPKVNPLEAD